MSERNPCEGPQLRARAFSGLVYWDPVSGKKIAKSAGTSDPKEAERRASELEKLLALGTAGVPSRLTWRLPAAV